MALPPLLRNTDAGDPVLFDQIIDHIRERFTVFIHIFDFQTGVVDLVFTFDKDCRHTA